MLKAKYIPYTLHFRQPAVTSRDILTRRDTYYLKIWHDEAPDCFGVGECALFRGLGDDDKPDYEKRLADLCDNINQSHSIDNIEWPEYTSICFGLETALNDLQNGAKRIIYRSGWSQGLDEIPINGLIWMGDALTMLSRIDEKLNAGFRCLKLKIGGINFEEELDLLGYIRSKYPPEQLELRLDANGSFTPDNALSRLERLSRYGIHSIEQPIKPRQYDAMRRLCNESPIAIALDEELIGLHATNDKTEMLDSIRPRYIILKPSLCGGFRSADKWIELADERNIGWWATSALESNIGLNAIAQWVSTFDTTMPQGLGTGALYTDNITSPIVQERDIIRYDHKNGTWRLPEDISQP